MNISVIIPTYKPQAYLIGSDQIDKRLDPIK